jgi:hypothetical protein
MRTLCFKSIMFWDVTPCSPVEVHRHFKGTYCKQISGWHQVHTGFLFAISFGPEGGCSTFLGNIGQILSDDTALYPRR